MSERRYSEDEVARILEHATDEASEPGATSGSGATGMTLAELQEIGREVGIAPERIARAAGALERAGPAGEARLRFLGVPIGVGRTVYLERPVTDAEWNRLVLDLRETFNARGKLREEGAFRSWSNGNLQALLEPTDTGHRLRLSTVKSDGRPSLVLSGALLALLPLALVGMALGLFSDADTVPLLLLGGLAGSVLLGRNLVRLPRWAGTRERQMEAVAARLLAAVNEAGPGADDDA